ncbi:MAG: hypothetical protein ACK4R2_10625 [Roseateles sp.]
MFKFLSSLFSGFTSSDHALTGSDDGLSSASDAFSTSINIGPSVNTNGMPMIEGTFIDVTGEPYGSTHIGGISTTDSWSTSSGSDSWSSSFSDSWSSSSSCGGSFGNDW